MKKLNTLIMGMLLMGANPVLAQQDTQAQQVLDKTIDTFRQAEGVSLTFGGSQEGTLKMQGTAFYLDCGGIKSWFDGKTQWSYVEENEEVTVSTPTPEELQGVNPYTVITSYRRHYHYRYQGTQTQGGKTYYRIQLTPLTGNNDISSVQLRISSDYRPESITVHLSNGKSQQFIVRSYKTAKGMDASTFRFDTRKYPNAEIIDMR